MAGPRPVLVLALFVSALGRVAAQGTFPDFSNEGGPPFVEGPVFEMDPEEDPATTVLAIGFVVNGTYTLSTNGPGGVVTLIGERRHTVPAAYLPAARCSPPPDRPGASTLMPPFHAGRYTSWECGPIPGSYLAAVEATIIQSDGTCAWGRWRQHAGCRRTCTPHLSPFCVLCCDAATSKVMCEYGLVDTSLGTNTM